MACNCGNSVCSCGESVLTLPTGAPGLPGPQGPTGPIGPIGLTGTAGTNGTQGPRTVIKLAIDFNSTGGSLVVLTGVTIASAGMLLPVYNIDANGIITTSMTAIASDFVWQVWRFTGTSYVDAAVEGTLTSLFVNPTSGDITIIATTGNYRLLIIG